MQTIMVSGLPLLGGVRRLNSNIDRFIGMGLQATMDLLCS